jgi:histidyl-tRNA synthetase
MIDTLVSVYERYGFTALETPALEYVDVLGKFLPEADSPQGGIFAFRDENSDWVGLRYDLTAPLSRVIAEYPELPRPFRRYQVGPVFRAEKPGPGRYREFHQCDFDTVGSASPLADAEVCGILSDAMEALGIPRGSYIVRVSDRKVLNGILERAGVRSDDADPNRVLTVMRAIDKMDRISLPGVRDLLGAGRVDESGDPTRGARLTPAQIEAIVRYLEVSRSDRPAHLREIGSLVAGSAVGEEGVAELARIDECLAKVGYGVDRVVFDPTVVRGLAYYTGPVFEVELTFEVKDETGATRRFGSVAGGGRYDDLVERFLGQKLPATGGSIGVDRLLAALSVLAPAPAGRMPGSVMVLVLHPSLAGESFALAHELRTAGLAAEVFLGKGSLRNQMKYADDRGIRCVVLVGEDELKAGTVSVKDLQLGGELAREVQSRETWKRERPAQVTVPRADLIPTLRSMGTSSTR